MGKYVYSRAAVVGLAVLAALVVAGSALAKAPPGDCGWVAASQPFTSWGDSGGYFLVPGGSFEDDTSGWSFTGAAVASGNELFYVNSPSDSQSLSLPDGASATTPSVCVTVQSPTARFFVLNTGAKDAKLEVDLNYTDDKGNARTQKLKDIGTDKTLGSWTLTNPIKFLGPINSLLDHDGRTNVSFTFAPKDSKGNWRIDDVYVDPLKSQ